MSTAQDRSDVIVIGAGLAGLSAAHALAADGARVTLLERRPHLGGRAYSYLLPALGETVDSQHVLLGCCTNLIDLCRRAGCEHTIAWYDQITFLEPGGRASVMRPGWLPAPAHQTASFLAAPMLTAHDKAGIARGLAAFLRGYPADDGESFAAWLQRTRQSERSIRHFWEPVVVATLNDTLDRCSTKYAGKVFHETLLRSAQGGRLGIPRLPLSDFLAPVAAHARALGVTWQTASVDQLQLDSGLWCVAAGERSFRADSVIVATDFRQAGRLLEGVGLPPFSARLGVSPITTVQLWYDRQVTELDHAALLDTRIQWMFHKSRIRGWAPERGSYLELTISASWPELEQGRQQVLELALAEARGFFPGLAEAVLKKSTVLKEARATFSVVPGLDHVRPAQRTALPGLYLAGDYTRTEWPSTMEGAVRSGRLAAGALVGDAGRFLAPELPASGLMTVLARQLPKAASLS